MKELTDIDGITAEVWGRELFEYEYCGECGKDYDEHDYVLLLGHWFARCRSSEFREVVVVNPDNLPCGEESKGVRDLYGRQRERVSEITSKGED